MGKKKKNADRFRWLPLSGFNFKVVTQRRLLSNVKKQRLRDQQGTRRRRAERKKRREAEG